MIINPSAKKNLVMYRQEVGEHPSGNTNNHPEINICHVGLIFQNISYF